MSDRLPPGLEEFGERLRQAAAAQIEEERRAAAPPPRRRASRTRRLLVALGAVILTGGAAAGAAQLLEHEGDPLPRETDAPTPLAPGAAAGVVASTLTPDPVGGLPWAVRVFTNSAGADCVALGRLRNGKLGQVENRVFRALPDGASGICGDVSTEGLVATVEQRAKPAPRTAVFGLSAGSGPVQIVLDGRSHTVQPRGLGAFLMVVEGVRGERIDVSTAVGDRRVVLKLRP